MFTQSSAILGPLEWISFNVAAVLGVAGLPHVLIRFFTVPDGKTARDSAIVHAWVTGLTFVIAVLIGYGAVALVGPDAIASASEGGNLAVLQLSELLGGTLLVTIISAATFAALLSTVAGLAIAASGAFAHDFYNNVFRNGEAS